MEIAAAVVFRVVIAAAAAASLTFRSDLEDSLMMTMKMHHSFVVVFLLDALVELIAASSLLGLGLFDQRLSQSAAHVSLIIVSWQLLFSPVFSPLPCAPRQHSAVSAPLAGLHLRKSCALSVPAFLVSWLAF